MSILDQDDINLIKQLLNPKFKQQHNGGWQLASELILPCLNVDRDEEIVERSSIYGSFLKNQGVRVTITAVVYVRNKILLGIAAVDGQEVEEKVPVVILAKNEWFKKQ